MFSYQNTTPGRGAVHSDGLAQPATPPHPIQREGARVPHRWSRPAGRGSPPVTSADRSRSGRPGVTGTLADRPAAAPVGPARDQPPEQADLFHRKLDIPIATATHRPLDVQRVVGPIARKAVQREAPPRPEPHPHPVVGVGELPKRPARPDRLKHRHVRQIEPHVVGEAAVMTAPRREASEIHAAAYLGRPSVRRVV